jgi:hypothetical protein
MKDKKKMKNNMKTATTTLQYNRAKHNVKRERKK